jgi:hypothetical protein
VKMMTSYLTHGLRRGRTMAVSVIALCALAAPAMAAQCAPREEVAKTLASNFNEKPAGMGLADSGSLVVIFVSPAGTWTAASVSAEGTACVLGVGNGWTDMTPPVGAVAQSDSTPTR